MAIQTKLDDVISFLEREMKAVNDACDNDTSYTTLDGNDVNAFEVFSAYYPIVLKVKQLAGKDYEELNGI